MPQSRPSEDAIISALTTLGLATPATTRDVDAAYKRLSRVYHPDTPGGGDAGMFRAITQARDTLRQVGADLPSIRLGFKVDASKITNELGALTSELHEEKKTTQILRRQLDGLAHDRLVNETRAKLKVQILTALSVVLLLGCAALGIRMYYTSPTGEAADTMAIRPSSYPITPGLGTLTLSFETTGEQLSAATFNEATPFGIVREVGPQVLVTAGELIDGRFVFRQEPGFRIKAHELKLELGERDQKQLRNLLAIPPPPPRQEALRHDIPTSPGIHAGGETHEGANGDE